MLLRVPRLFYLFISLLYRFDLFFLQFVYLYRLFFYLVPFMWFFLYCELFHFLCVLGWRPGKNNLVTSAIGTHTHSHKPMGDKQAKKEKALLTTEVKSRKLIGVSRDVIDNNRVLNVDQPCPPPLALCFTCI